ncbi:MAG: prolyl-tRNA synthetase [Amphiamblys sp. WSBS2006]|nr:MAG: prolyl-tRNA synthetase [Amphiamblys sp. WSBS2006]
MGEAQKIVGITAKKESDFFSWYRQVITRTDFVEYYDVSGCYILRPGSMYVWNKIKAFFTEKIEDLGVEEAYFPLFVTAQSLKKESAHVEGFEAEVAWITHAGKTPLAEPIAIRPTSETIIYPYCAKWIKSHRDLPMQLNQWCNAVRWEFSHPQPFIRSREFLWQEGHSMFQTQAEAEENAHQMLELYRAVYEDLLAVPVVKGRKSEKEKFAGSVYTTTVEAIIPTTGKAVQAATSHFLGQNFSRMFDVSFECSEGESHAGEKKKQHVWQTSWGLTTRSIGVMTMVHGDDRGLVIPPRVAQVQAVIIPCGVSKKTTEETRAKMDEAIERVERRLKTAKIRAKKDTRENYTVGWKFNRWELLGTPLRIEIGPRDLERGEVRAVHRVDGFSSQIKLGELEAEVERALGEIHAKMFSKAKEAQEEKIKRVDTFEEAVESMREKVLLVPWCGGVECETRVREKSKQRSVTRDGEEASGIKSLCIPSGQECTEKKRCFHCGEDTSSLALFGRSY